MRPNASRNFSRPGLYLKITALVLIAAGGIAALWLIKDHPQFRRGPYLQSVTPDSVWVVWETARPTTGRVDYGMAPDLGLAVAEIQAATHHELQLTGLKPYTLYTYRVDGGRQAQFRTAAAAAQTRFRFAVFGDTREGALMHRRIVSQILNAAPDFVLHTGDMVETGACTSCWDDFFAIERRLLQSIPFYPTLGNHEDDQSPFAQTHYFDIFHLPGNERWYSFDYGNARFISLKLDGYPMDVYFPQEEQLDWLEGQLSGNDKPWTFVYFHFGVYTSRDEDFLETGMRSWLVPLFERYGVKAVFMGHNHGYERVEVNNIPYITTAGGGASLYDLTSPEPGSQAAQRAFHFVLIEIDGDHLAGKAIDQGGKIIDQFELSTGK